MVDVQNTLVNLAFNQWGTEEQKQKYLTKLSTVFFIHSSAYKLNSIPN